MGFCVVSRDLAGYERQVDAEEAEREYYDKVAADLIRDFRTAGETTLCIGPNDYEHYDQSRLLESLYNYERSAEATAAFCAALQDSKPKDERLEAMKKFFDLAEDQMIDDLQDMAASVFVDDECDGE